MPPHQQRVVVEKTELDEKIGKLESFMNSSGIWLSLGDSERSRLTRQLAAMRLYSEILGERIAAF